MRMIFMLLASFLSLLLAGCGYFGTNQPYSLPKYSMWTGRNINDLVAAWGKPNRVTTAWNGNWEYVYYGMSHPKSMPATRTMTFVGPKNTTVGVTVPSSQGAPESGQLCSTIFQANPNNKILSVREEGNCGAS